MLSNIALMTLILYTSFSMSRRYYYIVLFYLYTKSLSESFLEIFLSLSSWCIMAYFFYHKSIFFLILKMLNVVTVYVSNMETPNRQSETSRSYLERVTVASNSNIVEASQFECIFDIILFAIFWGVTYV